MSLAQITPQYFMQFREQRLRQVKAGTVIRELGLLHAVFEVARREWDIPLSENPLAKVRKPKASNGRDRRLRADELSVLLTAADDCRNTWLKPSILLAIESGMRRGELLGVQNRHLDLSRGLLTIPHTKTDIPRTIPLSQHAVEILNELQAQSPGDDARLIPVSANAFRLAWERCKRRAAKTLPDIETLRFHDLRHEAVSRFFELGLSVPEVAAISGHRDPRMLFRYTHLRPEDIVATLRSKLMAAA